ncbi:MAG: hypothetical protein H7039_04920 [Bryobacteraceae bacterium]|nr:hypothetical protein [Bryobacteraceae bacterium]
MHNRKTLALISVLAVATVALIFGLRATFMTGTVAGKADEARGLPLRADEKPSPIAESVDIVKRKRVPNPVSPEDTPPKRSEPERKYASSDAAPDWSVVAATLISVESAQRRAQTLKEQWSDCACTIFPKGESEHYFVVVGSNLNRGAADQLRDRATAAGFPPDTYVTKLSARLSAKVE